jgi:Holliday junction resolvase RusA-like endonuclease
MFIGSSSEFLKWATFAGLFFRRAKTLETIDYPVNLEVRCYFVNHAHEQDLENVISSVADVLEDVGVISNDKLFHSYDGSRKIFGAETDYLEIKITKLDPI